jgi:hypothetical protein
MDRNFARALALVLKSEGGWSDNPADPGGAAMKGVTLANFFRRYVQANATKDNLRHIIDGPGRAAKYLQAVAGVDQDGRIGPDTLAAVRAKPADVVVDTLCDNRMAFRQGVDQPRRLGSLAGSVDEQGTCADRSPPCTCCPAGVVATQQGNEPSIVTPVTTPPSTAPQEQDRVEPARDHHRRDCRGARETSLRRLTWKRSTSPADSPRTRSRR